MLANIFNDAIGAAARRPSNSRCSASMAVSSLCAKWAHATHDLVLASNSAPIEAACERATAGGNRTKPPIPAPATKSPSP
jgi:hypothetical protein